MENVVSKLREALIDLMAAEGGEPGETEAQQNAWQQATEILESTETSVSVFNAVVDQFKEDCEERGFKIFKTQIYKIESVVYFVITSEEQAKEIKNLAEYANKNY